MNLTPRSSVRVGDVERDDAVSALGDHYAAGRLSRDELDVRCAAVWSARTIGALSAPFADLPAPRPGRVLRVGGGGPRLSGESRSPRARPPLPVLVLLAVVGLVLLGRVWPLLLLALGVWWLTRGLRGSRATATSPNGDRSRR